MKIGGGQIRVALFNFFAALISLVLLLMQLLLQGLISLACPLFSSILSSDHYNLLSDLSPYLQFCCQRVELRDELNASYRAFSADMWLQFTLMYFKLARRSSISESETRSSYFTSLGVHCLSKKRFLQEPKRSSSCKA